jgi:hypothetical protein
LRWEKGPGELHPGRILSPEYFGTLEYFQSFENSLHSLKFYRSSGENSGRGGELRKKRRTQEEEEKFRLFSRTILEIATLFRGISITDGR